MTGAVLAFTLLSAAANDSNDGPQGAFRASGGK